MNIRKEIIKAAVGSLLTRKLDHDSDVRFATGKEILVDIAAAAVGIGVTTAVLSKVDLSRYGSDDIYGF